MDSGRPCRGAGAECTNTNRLVVPPAQLRVPALGYNLTADRILSPNSGQPPPNHQKGGGRTPRSAVRETLRPPQR